MFIKKPIQIEWREVSNVIKDYDKNRWGCSNRVGLKTHLYSDKSFDTESRSAVLKFSAPLSSERYLDIHNEYYEEKADFILESPAIVGEKTANKNFSLHIPFPEGIDSSVITEIKENKDGTIDSRHSMIAYFNTDVITNKGDLFDKEIESLEEKDPFLSAKYSEISDEILDNLRIFSRVSGYGYIFDDISLSLANGEQVNIEQKSKTKDMEIISMTGSVDGKITKIDLIRNNTTMHIVSPPSSLLNEEQNKLIESVVSLITREYVKEKSLNRRKVSGMDF